MNPVKNSSRFRCLASAADVGYSCTDVSDAGEGAEESTFKRGLCARSDLNNPVCETEGETRARFCVTGTAGSVCQLLKRTFYPHMDARVHLASQLPRLFRATVPQPDVLARRQSQRGADGLIKIPCTSPICFMRAARTLADCTGCCGQLGLISGPVDNGEGARSDTGNGERERKDGGKQHGDGKKLLKRTSHALLVLLLGNDII